MRYNLPIMKVGNKAPRYIDRSVSLTPMMILTMQREKHWIKSLRVGAEIRVS